MGRVALIRDRLRVLLCRPSGTVHAIVRHRITFPVVVGLIQAQSQPRLERSRTRLLLDLLSLIIVAADLENGPAVATIVHQYDDSGLRAHRSNPIDLHRAIECNLLGAP